MFAIASIHKAGTVVSAATAQNFGGELSSAKFNKHDLDSDFNTRSIMVEWMMFSTTEV